jgi:putative oxidoreductase
MNHSSQAIAALVGRIGLASLFLISGFGKLAAPAATKAYIASSGLPFPDLAYLGALVVEIGFSLVLIAGWRTRTVAGLMALFAVATALAFHHQFSDQNQLIHFLKNLAIAGGLLQVVAFGGGALSLDNRRQHYAAKA